MIGNNYFIDTNILIYLLDGDETLADLLNQKHFVISFITELELLSYQNLTNENKQVIRELIDECTVIDINLGIKQQVIKLRAKYKLKLPDAIIVASAIHSNLPLITADKALIKIENINIILYELS